MSLVKIGQAAHMGKFESHVAMVRLVRDLQQRLEENGLLSSGDSVQVDNVLYTFLSVCPKKVVNEVLHG